MKNQIFTLVLILAAITTNAQTAVDFTRIDCDSTSQHLFATLDLGKVVALDYEHECGMCTMGTSNLSTVIKTHYNGDTNIIVMYLDNGGNSCATTANWISTNNFVTGPSFEYSNDQSSPYGSGMPVIVICAGSNHKIYLTANGASAADTASIHDAIRDALTELSSTENFAPLKKSFDVFPNPAYDNTTVSIKQTTISPNTILSIFNVEGQLIQQQLLENENTELNLSRLTKGVYFIKLSGNDQIAVTKLIKE